MGLVVEPQCDGDGTTGLHGCFGGGEGRGNLGVHASARDQRGESEDGEAEKHGV